MDIEAILDIFKYVTPEWISALASVVAAGGVFLAYGQLKISKNIAQLEFEDGLSKEYRELASNIPTKALLGIELTEEEFQRSFDELYRYIDLTNEQVSLRQRNRVKKEAWLNWSSGIQSNLARPSFKRAWSEIKENPIAFRNSAA